MKLVNPTPMVANAFRQFDRSGGLDVVVVAKATFQHRQKGRMRWHDTQEPFQWEDGYAGDPHAGPLLRQSDLVPEKVGTDITFLGNAYAPDGVATASWEAMLSLGPITKSVAVHGERHWQPVVREAWAGFRARAPKRVLTDWRLGEAEPTLSVPLDWRRSYGGAVPGTGDPGEDIPADVEARNPLGRGMVDLGLPADTGPVPAPQVTTPNAKLDWQQPDEPQGFGPISPWWRQRQRYAGTYDQTWLDERHPLLPGDFDVRFWQSAPLDQVAIPFLNGEETYRFCQLSAVFPEALGQLPYFRCAVHVEGTPAAGWHRLNLDGVAFDWRADHRIVLTWRTRIALPNAEGVTLTLARVDDREVVDAELAHVTG